VDGFILPGHVSAIIGVKPYGFLASEFRTPSVITGFGAEDILEGILMLLGQIASGRPEVETEYGSVVREEGNPTAVRAIYEYFEPADAHWRGIGVIPGSGLALRAEKKRFEAGGHVQIEVREYPEPKGCSCGEVLRGLKAPTDCALFGRRCTPERPVGACMVSTEGSCAAYYRYGRQRG
jgi:hydrogenase expression/formation protein HypD